MKFFPLVFTLCLAFPGVCDNAKPTFVLSQHELGFQKVLAAKGFVWLQDAGTDYVFRKNGTFESEPRDGSGRTLHGFWKQESKTDPMVEVEALRGWQNGRSVIGDFRKIRFYVGGFGILEKQEHAQIVDGQSKTASIYKTYWFVDSLEQMARPKNWNARMSKIPRATWLSVPTPLYVGKDDVLPKPTPPVTTRTGQTHSSVRKPRR